MILRDSLKTLLEQEGIRVIGEASDGHAAVKICGALKPDVAILDLGMPLLNGIDAAQEIRNQSPETKIILLTMYGEQSSVLAGLRAGIAGYVLKSSAASNLVEALDAVLRNEIYLSPGVSRVIVEAYLSGEPAPPDPLSVREREVLQLIAEGKNMKEIGEILGISARTAETHRARIMSKLNIHHIPGLVRYAISHRLVTLNGS